MVVTPSVRSISIFIFQKIPLHYHRLLKDERLVRGMSVKLLRNVMSRKRVRSPGTRHRLRTPTSKTSLTSQAHLPAIGRQIGRSRLVL